MLTSEQIDDLVFEALNAAVRHIQDNIGVTTGDRAGLFFTGQYGDEITKRLRQYTVYELNMMEFQ